MPANNQPVHYSQELWKKSDFSVLAKSIEKVTNMKPKRRDSDQCNVRVDSSKVQKPNKTSKSQEIQNYLSKLKSLVPDMPEDPKLSKLEVIRHVIDYIQDLQEALDNRSEVDRQFIVYTNRQPLSDLSTQNQITHRKW